MAVCLEQGADLHMAQLMPLPLTVSCFSKIQIGFTFLILADLGSPGKRAVKRVCVCYVLCLWFQSVLENLCRVTNRAPMQWSDKRFAGFTSGNKTWIKVSDDYHSVNVEV